MAKSKPTGLLTVLWCNTCNLRPEYLIQGYKCPECNCETVKKEVPREIAFPRRNDNETDALAWLEG